MLNDHHVILIEICFTTTSTLFRQALLKVMTKSCPDTVEQILMKLQKKTFVEVYLSIFNSTSLIKK